MNIKNLMIRLKKIILLAVLWLPIQNSIGQPLAAIKPADSYTFVKEKVNVISNSGHLSGLMEKLYDLKKNGKRTVNILHIGDSHLQADFITSVIRTTLQKAFGKDRKSV